MRPAESPSSRTPHSVPPYVLPALAATHARVEAVRIIRLEAWLPHIDAPARAGAEVLLTAARARSVVFEAAVHPGADVHETATLLGVELAESSDPKTLTDEDFALAADFARAELTEITNQAGEAQLALDALLEAWPPREEHTDEDYATHVNMRKRTTKLLAERAGPACTARAREALAMVSRPPDVAPKPEAASRAHAEATHLAAVRAAATCAGRLQARADAFAAIATLKHMPADAHARRLACAVLGEPRSPAPSVREFNAFCGARAMPEVVRARAASLTQVGPIFVSEPVEVARLPKMMKTDVPVVALSACGVLCVSGCCTLAALTVTHLLTQRTIAIARRGWHIHGFVHTGRLYVAQQGHAVLWHAPVAEVLAGRTDLRTFEQFPLVAKWGPSPCLDAAPAGWVAVANNDNWTQHMVVDLAARTSRLVDVWQRLPHIGGFTGIAVPDVAWAVTTNYKGSGNTVFAVSPDGATRRITDGMCQYPTVLPSASAPADLARAAVLDQLSEVSAGGARAELRGIVQPYSQSLVRLHQDVFLCWDRNREAWFAVRIVVP